MMRGKLTDDVQEVAVTHLGRELDSPEELRLMAYVDYVMKNEQWIDLNNCNQADRDVLSKWREEGHIEGGASGLAITKDFYDAVQEILFVGYVIQGGY